MSSNEGFPPPTLLPLKADETSSIDIGYPKPPKSPIPLVISNCSGVFNGLMSCFFREEPSVECNLPNGVESDSLVVCNASSSCFDGDHDDIPAIFSNVLLIIPPPVLLLPISAITSPNSTTVSAIFLKTEVTFFKDSSDKSAWTFSSILSCTRSSSRSNRGITFPLPNCPDFTSDFILSLTFSSVHDVIAGDILWFSEESSSLKCFGDILVCMYSSISVAVSTSFDFLCAAVVFFISALQTRVYTEELKRSQPNISSTTINGKLENEFANWFNDYAHDPSNNISNKFIKDLAKGPLRCVNTYSGYYVNGFKFHTIGYGGTKETMNSGVCIKGTNYSIYESDYYGQLVEVVQIEYPGLPVKRTILFKCEWFDPTNVGMKVHSQYKLVEVNHKRRFNRYEPFVLAVQACQVYYCTYPSLCRDKLDWWAVCKIKARSEVEVPESSISSEESLVATPFQEEITENQDLMQIDEDPSHLNDPNGGVIELDGEHGDNEDELELEEETDTQVEMTRGGSSTGRIRGRGQGTSVTPSSSSPSSSALPSPMAPPPTVVSPPTVAPVSTGSPSDLPISSPSDSTVPPTSSSVEGSSIGPALPIVHVEDGR
nr:uncharacterized protein LOC109179592 [Ipomoea batatas]